uniref:FBD domain-containing protein n=1 Tax=Leersia perrieri TaxID=77586 RepID=A0A0D9XYZ9_9ORYZ
MECCRGAAADRLSALLLKILTRLRCADSLQQLNVDANFQISINIVTPMLMKLYLNTHRGVNTESGFTFSAPAVEDLTWKYETQTSSRRFGVRWRMWSISFSSSLDLDNYSEIAGLPSSWQQSTDVGVLSLNLQTYVLQEIHPRALRKRYSNFRLCPTFLFWSWIWRHEDMSTEQSSCICLAFIDNGCFVDCRCDQPNNWRNQSISLTDHKEVEINGFRGQGHEVDLLKILLRCAIALERVTVRYSRKVSPSEIGSGCMEISGILEGYPSVKYNIYYHKSGKRVLICN